MTDEPARPGRVGLAVCVAGVLWNAGTLWLAHRSVVGAGNPAVALINAALAMPLLISTGLVAGAAVAVTVVRRVHPPRRRLLVGAGAGLGLGAVAAALVLLGYGTAGPLVSLAVAIAVAATLGGLAGAAPWPTVVVAGLAGTLGQFLVGVLEGLLGGRLREALAGDGSAPAQLAAVGRVGFAAALVGGAVAGLVASLWLRRADPERAWPAHVVAGATPGLLLLVADVATRVGGGPLLRAATGDEFDRSALDLVGDTRLSTAMVVLFVGAIVAIVAHGRTLTPASAPDRAPSGRTTPARGPQRRRR